MSLEVVRIAVVTPIPTPYRDLFWNAVSRQEGVELHVFYCSAGKKDRPWEVSWPRDYHAEVLPGVNLSAWWGRDTSCFWNPTIRSRLRRGHYDAVVIGGYNHPTMLAAIAGSIRSGVPYFLMCESHLRSPRAWWRRWVKERFVRWIVTRAAGGFPTGILAREYLMHYGASAENLTPIPNAPDVVSIAGQVADWRARREEVRRAHELDGYPVLLFVGRLIPSKGVARLIGALHALRPRHEANLVILGDGPERRSLEQLARRLGVDRQVRFMGFTQPSDLPKWYATADLFVLPSSETWGVVVLEALASGLPVVVTDEVGCYPDVIIDPLVGGVVPARDESALAAAIDQRLRESVSPDAVARTWRPVFETLKYHNLANRFLAAVGRGIGCGWPRDRQADGKEGRGPFALNVPGASHEEASGNVDSTKR
jgi:glycosyltransferase involved in cell wall biosynthesis